MGQVAGLHGRRLRCEKTGVSLARGNGLLAGRQRRHPGDRPLLLWCVPALVGTEVPKGDDSVERMAVFRSRNGGKTWTLEPELGSDYAEHYQSVLCLEDKRLLFTFTVRGLRPPLGLQAVLGTEKPDGFTFGFKSDRLVLDEKTPADKPSGGGFGNTVQLPDGQLVSAYTYRGEDGNVRAEVLRWALPELAKK